MPLTVEPLLPKTAAPGATDAATRVPQAAVKSEALFGDACEVLIDHRGVMYRLRLTSLGKLILTK